MPCTGPVEIAARPNVSRPGITVQSAVLLYRHHIGKARKTPARLNTSPFTPHCVTILLTVPKEIPQPRGSCPLNAISPLYQLCNNAILANHVQGTDHIKHGFAIL